jgi:hypothetical protein
LAAETVSAESVAWAESVESAGLAAWAGSAVWVESAALVASAVWVALVVWAVLVASVAETVPPLYLLAATSETGEATGRTTRNIAAGHRIGTELRPTGLGAMRVAIRWHSVRPAPVKE